MNFLHTDLGQRGAGVAVKVTLEGNAANVMLLDATNFSSYQAGGTFRYFGGHAKRSPVVLRVPHAAHWHLVVDLGGAVGQVRAGVEVIA